LPLPSFLSINQTLLRTRKPLSLWLHLHHLRLLRALRLLEAALGLHEIVPSPELEAQEEKHKEKEGARESHNCPLPYAAV